METYVKSLNSVFLPRMRTATLMTALCVFMLAAGIANAVTYTNSAAQTTAGQNFVFTFFGVEPWSSGDGTLTIHARGDYSVKYPSEHLSWGIEGLASDIGAPAYGTVIHEFSHDDVEWEQSYTINGSIINAITSDSVIYISVDLESNVDIIGINSFVAVELTYNASGPPCPPPPEPNDPEPVDGAENVPIDTCLAWNGSVTNAASAGDVQIDIDINGYPNADVPVQVVPEHIRAALDSLIESSGILDGPIVLSSEEPYESGQDAEQTVTYTSAEEIAQVKTAAELGINTTSLLNVVVCGAKGSGNAYNQDVQQKLLGTGNFNTVSIINVNVVTPTLSELQAFDAAIVFSDSRYDDAIALGNAMADYMDAGGGVVCAVFEVAGSMSYNMRGRWLSGGYPLIPYSGKRTGSASLGIVHNPGHPVMSGVGSFHGGSSSYRPTTTSLNPGATCVAEWSDGSTLVAVKETASCRRVDLGFYPPSSDARSDFWNSSTDGALLMANALTWAAGIIPQPECPVTWDVYFGTEPGGMELVCINVDEPNCCPGLLEPGTIYFWQVIAKNPSSETPGEVWSFRTEGGEPPECDNAVPSVAEIWPPRHEWVDIEILDVTDPDGDPVTITITGITQDEPVAGPGSGRTSPDGMGVGTSVAHIRAERTGQSDNCRVYEISFEADDGMGNTCNGSVNVHVPHDQGKKHECVDDGQIYDSTATEMFKADINNDGIIDLLDFNILADYWLVSWELED